MRNSIGSLVYQTLLTIGCLLKLFMIFFLFPQKYTSNYHAKLGLPDKGLQLMFVGLPYVILFYILTLIFSIIPYKCLDVYNILYLILYYYNIIIICLSLETFYNKLLCPIWWLRVFIPF